VSAIQAVLASFPSEALHTVQATMMEAMSRPDSRLWRESTQDELRSLRENKAWELTDAPQGTKLTGSPWVFEPQCGAAGSDMRNKERTAVRGSTRKRGVDFDEVWALGPVKAKVRAAPSLSAARLIEVHSLDIITACLNAMIDKDVYV